MLARATKKSPPRAPSSTSRSFVSLISHRHTHAQRLRVAFVASHQESPYCAVNIGGCDISDISFYLDISYLYIYIYIDILCMLLP